jgi:hypothetical protein
MKRTLGIALAAAFAISAVSAPALAGPPEHGEKAFGAGITYHCGATYGELVSAAIRSGHIDGPVGGARAFATEPVAALGGLTLLEAHIAEGACPDPK